MISVMDHGALGDGVADDGPALQAALTAGGWVYVPPGAYRVGSGLPLRIYSDTRLTLAPGATIVRGYDAAGMLQNGDDGQNLPGYGGHGNIVVEGGTWDVRGAALPGPSGCLSFVHGENITVRDVTILDVAGHHAIEVNAIRTVRIERCRFVGFVDTGGRASSEAVQLDGAFGPNGWDRWGPYDGTPCTDVTVASCYFGGSDTTGTTVWGRGVGSHSSAPSTPADHTHVKVTGCTFEGVVEAVRAWRWAKAIVSANHISGGGISVHESQWVAVQGNQIFDAPNTGIWLNDVVRNVSLRDNDIVGSSRSADNYHYGIRLSSDVDGTLIVGNKVRRSEPGHNAKYGLSVTGTSHETARSGNDFRWSGMTGSLLDQGTGTATSATDLT